MELDKTFGKIFCCGNSEIKKAVIPVESSIILPDYFPDVMKILRYTAKTVKSPVFSEGGTETVSGNINIEVNYVSEEGELCSCSQLQPFSHGFETEGKIIAAEAEVSVGEIGCRAVNKRRIDIHGSIEIILRTISGEEKRTVSSVSGAGAVCKTEKAETVVIAGEFYKNFTVEEKGELGFGKPPFGKVLRSSAFAEVTECHVIQDKIVTKGEIRAEVLWVPEEISETEEEGPFLSKFSFPVSRMVDAKGIFESDICDAQYEADFPEILPSEDGENVIIKIKVGIFARVYRKETAEFVSDMFSTDFETKAEKGKINFINEAFPLSVTEPVFEKFDLPETAEKVLDIWLENNLPKVSEEGKVCFSSKLCLFAKDSDGTPVYFEKLLEREISSPAEGKNIAFYNLSAGIRNAEFVVSGGGKAEVSASVLIDGTIFSSLSTEATTECSIDAEKKIEHGDAAMLLCFAEKGEKIWDIAKKYGASLESVMNENKISEEILSEKTMLVITR